MIALVKASTQGIPDQLRIDRDKLNNRIGRDKASTYQKAHTAVVDEYFLTSFAQSTVGQRMDLLRNPYALIALGGYGRGEHCVFSDIDLLFLFERKVPSEAEALVQEIIYPLWDMGLEVGHATRSIKECLEMARLDLEVMTSILDARFICGISPLFHQLMEKLRVKLVNAAPQRLINKLLTANEERHEKFGDSAYLLEPNLKEGQGGLRDYHTMLWIARIQSNIKHARDLEYYGYLSHDEYQNLNTSLEYVWNVRNHLHRLMNRKCDRLHLENQIQLADAMRIKSRNGHIPVEMLMGELHGQMEYIKQCYRIFVYELDQNKRLKRKNKALKFTEIPGLKFNRGMLNFISPESIVDNPQLLIKIFLESSVHKAPLNTEARRLVKDFGHIVEKESFRHSPEVVQIFERIMTRPSGTFNALSALLETGFLEHFIPEFKHVINRIQFDQYHLYPVARHLLLTLENVKANAADKSSDVDDLDAKIYQEIRNKKPLLWAALLHDIGKGEPTGGHSERGAEMAARLLSQKGMAQADIDTVVFLIRDHLLLFETATRRDINDEETALFVARQVVKSERLKMLYLLSVADARATGPKAWNQWTSSLMRSLFLKTLNAMQSGELASRRATRIIAEKRDRIMTASATESQRQSNAALIDVMSPRYLLYTHSQEIPQHIELYNQLQDRPFVWRIDKSADERTRTVTLCAKDRPGLLSNVAGVLTLNNINILDVHIFTWRNNVALDLFEVQPPPDPIFEEERWQKAGEQMKNALTGQLDIGKSLELRLSQFKPLENVRHNRAQKVVIDNETSSFFTIVEVFAWDFPGLLYRITDALFRCRLDIWVAKIATRVDQVVDVFYVRNFDGEKVDRPEEEATVRESIEAVLK